MHVLHFLDQAFERVGLHFGRAAQFIFVAHQMLDLLIEDLP